MTRPPDHAGRVRLRLLTASLLAGSAALFAVSSHPAVAAAQLGAALFTLAAARRGR